MSTQDLKIGACVCFHDLINKCLHKEVFKIIKLDFENWGACNCLLESQEDGAKIYTNNQAIEIAPQKKVFTIFDFI